MKQGVRFSVYAWGDAGYCELADFLEELERQSNPDATRISLLISRAAEQGPSPNEQHCRQLKGKHAEGLFEFKAPGGARVLWFYDANRIIICTHGFVKKKDKTPRSEIDRAQSIRQQYLKEKKHET